MILTRLPGKLGKCESWPSSLAILASLFLSACATTAPTNILLEKTPALSYSFDQWIDEQKVVREREEKSAPDNESLENIKKAHENLVVMSFSGGGARAAALAAAVVEELGEHRNRVAIISSASGGSVTAGYLAAGGTRSLEKLWEKFLERDNMKELTPQLFPLYLTGGNRSKVFAKHLDEHLFEPGLTFGTLASLWSRNQPFVVLNASDMSSGSNFVFTQASFGALCSDLSAYPLTEAIAASAAVPIAMSPITLKNFWNDSNCVLRDSVSDGYDAYYQDAYAKRYSNLPNFLSARYLHSLRHAHEPESVAGTDKEPYRRPKFIHLLDGGLSDNLASRVLLRTFAGETIPKLRAIGVRRILLVQVNAKSDAPNDALDGSPDSPGIWEMFKTAVLNPIDVTTALSAYRPDPGCAFLVRFHRQASK